MLLASLQSVPDEMYEACRVDGGNALQSFFYITIPHIKETLVLTTLLRVIWEFNSVDLILNLTGGGLSTKPPLVCIPGKYRPQRRQFRLWKRIGSYFLPDTADFCSYLSKAE